MNFGFLFLEMNKICIKSCTHRLLSLKFIIVINWIIYAKMEKCHESKKTNYMVLEGEGYGCFFSNINNTKFFNIKKYPNVAGFLILETHF